MNASTINGATTIQMYGIVEDSIVDGPGLRFSVFVQGCPHHCKGCHNPESWNIEGGYQQSLDALVQEIEAAKLTQGITLTGGEPFDQAPQLAYVVRELKEHNPALSIWAYSGYHYEDLLVDANKRGTKELLDLCDVLVDGPFIQELNSYELIWKGSSNQRVIDLKKTRIRGEVILWHEEDLGFEPPASW